MDDALAPKGSSPPKKRRQYHPPPAQSPSPLLIPLESRLEDNPDPHKGLEGSSADSSESEVSLSGESADREPTAEPVPQVMAQYSRAKPSSAVESSLVISRQLALRLATSKTGALAELQALAVLEPPVPSPTTSQPMALEYTPAQLESSQTNLEVCARQVRAYMVDHREWAECVQPPLPSALPIQMTNMVTWLPGHAVCGRTPDNNHGAQGRPERVVHQQSAQSVALPFSTVWVICHEDK